MIIIPGHIVDIRTLEDCIRNRTQYREVINQVKQPYNNNDSKIITKVYWIFLHIPDELSMDSSISDILMYLMPEAIIRFWYDYRSNRAELKAKKDEWKYLCKEVPDLYLCIRHLREATEAIEKATKVTVYKG